MFCKNPRKQIESLTGFSSAYPQFSHLFWWKNPKKLDLMKLLGNCLINTPQTTTLMNFFRSKMKRDRKKKVCIRKFLHVWAKHVCSQLFFIQCAAVENKMSLMDWKTFLLFFFAHFFFMKFTLEFVMSSRKKSSSQVENIRGNLLAATNPHASGVY